MNIIEQIRKLSDSKRRALLNEYFAEVFCDGYVYSDIDEVIEIWGGVDKELVLSIIHGNVKRAYDYMRIDGYGNLYNVNLGEVLNDHMNELVDYLKENPEEGDKYGLDITNA